MSSRRAFTAIVLGVALGVSVLGALWFSSRIAQEYEREFLQRSEWLARNFADQVWLQLRTIEDPSRLRSVFNTMVDEFVVMDPVIYAQIVLDGELIAQHQHLGDAPVERVLALPEGAVPARHTERKRLEGGREYLDIWRAIEPGRTDESTSYVRLGISLTPLHEAIWGLYQMVLLWAVGFALVMGGVAYLSWPWWVKGRPLPRPLPDTERGASPPPLGEGSGERSRTLSFGQLVIDDHAKEVRLNGTVLPLTPREYALLRLLAAEPGRVFSAQEIIERAWATEKSSRAKTSRNISILCGRRSSATPKTPRSFSPCVGLGTSSCPRLSVLISV
jgi:hypothetical protein